MVRSVEFMDRDAKLEDEAFRQQFQVDIDMLLGDNPLRDSYEITLTKECSTVESVEKLRWRGVYLDTPCRYC